MKKVLLFIMLLYSVASSCQIQMKGWPCGFEQGYEKGVSACFAGCIGDKLVMAGGCNFPQKGQKKYYQGIYAADVNDDNLSWQQVGELPEPVAYGITVQDADSLVVIGGNNAETGLATAYSIHLADGKAEVRQLPSLPYPIDNMAGTLCNGYVYVVGGNQSGVASASVLRLKLDGGVEWETVSAVPGQPRVQPVCVAADGALYLWGGFFVNGEESIVHTDGYKYDVASGEWTQLAAPTTEQGEPVTLSGGTAVAVGSSIVCTGGVNKDIFLDAISGRYQMVEKTEYVNQPVEWYRFNPHLFVYDVAKEQWLSPLAASPNIARAGAVLVYSPSTKMYYLIGGEVKPTVRTPEIARFSL